MLSYSKGRENWGLEDGNKSSREAEDTIEVLVDAEQYGNNDGHSTFGHLVKLTAILWNIERENSVL